MGSVVFSGKPSCRRYLRFEWTMGTGRHASSAIRGWGSLMVSREGQPVRVAASMTTCEIMPEPLGLLAVLKMKA
jgi:hypothetical protein